MKYCMNCGAELGEGRFCTNCGTPVGSATPPVPSPRVEARPASATPVAATPGDRPHWTGWLLLAVGIVLAVVLGSCLGRGGDQDASAAEPGPATSSAPTSPTPAPTATARDTAGVDLSREASVEAPQPIRPGTDLAGNPVPYPATNMLDGKRASAYRLAGDATGTVIRFSFTDDRTISAVGLINGYAKVDAGTDWYPLNRRIETVEWTFADGTTLLQQLVDTSDLQAVQIVPETTSWVELRIVQVTEPGDGRGGKDTTAISDVLLLGS